MYSYNLLFSRAFASPCHFFYFCQFEGRKKVISLFLFVFPCVFIYLHFLFWKLPFPSIALFFSVELFILSHTFVGAPCLRDMNPLCYVLLPVFWFSLPFVFVPCLWHFFHAQILSFYLVESVILYLMGPRFPVLLKSPTPKFIWIFSHMLSALLL